MEDVTSSILSKTIVRNQTFTIRGNVGGSKGRFE
jgi:hypothetical protein